MKKVILALAIVIVAMALTLFAIDKYCDYKLGQYDLLCREVWDIKSKHNVVLECLEVNNG